MSPRQPVRETVRDYLLDCGADVVSVRSADAAMLVLAGAPPDALVSDIRMPGHDGFWLIRAVRALPARGGDVPAIAMTGRLDSAELAALIAGLAARC